MTSRAWLIVFLLFFLLMDALLTVNGALAAFAIPFVLYLGAGVLLAPSLPPLQARRSLDQDTVLQDRPVHARIEIEGFTATVEEAYISDVENDELALVAGATQTCQRLVKGQSAHLDYTFTASRSNIVFRDIEVSANDPFNLFHYHQTLTAPANVLVLPVYAPIRSFRIRPASTHGFAGSIPIHRGGSGLSFFGVREYQPGDPQRQLNWRVAARYEDSLFTNEYEQERIADVGIILDARSRNNLSVNGKSFFEYAVHAAAVVSEALLHDGNRVSLLVYGNVSQRVFPGYGKPQLRRILRVLARLRVSNNTALDSLRYLPTRQFPSRSQLIMVSPLGMDDLPILLGLRSQGYSLMVISPDLVEFESRLYPDETIFQQAARLARIERAAILRNLRRAGVELVDWDTRQALDQTIQLAQAQHAAARRFQEGIN
jgi:uncharacterized protein (DUF58 family)